MIVASVSCIAQSSTNLDHPKTGLIKPGNLATQARQVNAQAATLARVTRIATQVQAAPPFCSPTQSAADFRGLGFVSPVKDQGTCGACWAFGTNAVLESSYLSRAKLLVNASEQELISCSSAALASGGCDGGWWAFDFARTPGVESSSRLPYQAASMKCPGQITTDFHIIEWGYVDPVGDIPADDQLKAALCQHGPLAVGINATLNFTNFFRSHHAESDVYSESNEGAINHAVELVGWDNDKKAWLIKNSWGTGFGIAGFMWVHYGDLHIGDGAAWAEVQPVVTINTKTFTDLQRADVQTNKGRDFQLTIPAASEITVKPQ